MSFLSDFFSGNFGNLGTDIVDAPSSLINHPSELLDVGLGAAAIAAPFAIPEIGAGLGIGSSIDAAAGGGLAADLGIGDIGAAAAADTAGLASADVAGSTAADFGFLSGAAPDVLAAGGDTALGFGADTSLSADPGLSSWLQDPSLGADATTAASFTDPTAAAAGSGDFAPGSALSPAAPSASVAAPTGAATPNSAFGALTQGSGIGGDVTNAPEIAQYADNPSFGVPSLTDKLGGLLGSPWTKLAVGAAPLALALGMGTQQLPASAQQLQGQATALQQQGLTDLSKANAGVLNAGQTAVLAKSYQDQVNNWRQTLANQGVQDPTKDARWPQIMASIDASITQQTAGLIQQNITNALAETGQASTALTSIAQMQMTADQNFTNNLIGATKALGFAAGSRTTTTTTTG
jgi:hypothetical protein